MAYTVKQLADLAGVSVRTLHHYDTIGLLKPGYVADNGYRIYEAPELVRLQQILLYREMDLPLEDIARIIDADDFDVMDSLYDQTELLKRKRRRLDRLINTIQQTLHTMEHDQQFEDAHRFSGFSDEQIQEFKKEVHEKYDPKLVAQSSKRVTSWSKEKMQQVQEEGMNIVKAIADARENGRAIDSPEVQGEIARYHAHMNQFYDCSLEIFAGLGEMYVQDQRFTKYYEDVQEGLAKFMRDAMQHYAQKNTGL